MAKPPLLIGLGAAIFLIQALLVGINVASMLAASLIVLLLMLLMIGIKHVNALQPEKVLLSLEQNILPLVRRQIGNSASFSQQALHQMTAKVEQLKDATIQEDTGSQVTSKHQDLLNDLLVLLQFGDRLKQQQNGTIDSVEVIETALKEAHKLGWSEQEVLERLNQIEQKTRIENDKSPQDEGKVTYF
ncbi:hypothetical protein [Vibrio europaeus]|uniref:hypothetical protein n=1 Tax=Vibrio europaeus TaxID=300876 RepID=UPI00233F29A5|nr:hypothetical protein [Vibrio europaeus]MDC5852882.1 hypothetical protein [Vibrio europaeus]